MKRVLVSGMMLVACLSAACRSNSENSTNLELQSSVIPPAGTGTADTNPVVLALGARSLRWNELEHALKFDITSLPADSSKHKAWLEKEVGDWINRELMLIAAAEDAVETQVSEDEYRTWFDWVRQDASKQALEQSLAAKGLAIADWERHEREEFLLKAWVETKWPFPEDSGHALAYYNAHLDEFSRPDEIRLRQLVTDSETKAQALRARILAGESFAKLAIDYSLSPDRMNGGDLGFFAKEELPASFADICFNLPVGALSPVVKSEYGHHLFKVLDRRAARIIPFEKAKAQIIRQLRDDWVAKNLKQWLEARRKALAPNPKWGLIREAFNRFVQTRKVS